MIYSISSEQAPKAVGPYSQAISIDGLVFTSGQIALTLEGKLLEGTIAEQTHQVMQNLRAVLAAADLTFENVVKTTIFVTDMADYATINQVYGSYLSEPYPARETIGVQSLPLGARVEISLIACR